MSMTRRELGQLALGAVPAIAGLSIADGLGAGLLAQAGAPAARPTNRSYIGGVQFGLQPFCYHDLPMTPENRGTLLKRLVQNGLGMVEMHASWVEPRFPGPDGRAKLREWRLSIPADHYRAVKKEYADQGVEICSYYLGLNDSFTDAEIDAVYEGAKILGARGIVGSQGYAITSRVAKFPEKHGMFIGIHNHANLWDADQWATEEKFAKGLALGPGVRATLDTRHYTAANGDSVAFIKKHHARMFSLHLGDRRRNNGRSTPFGEGDTPIIEVLRLIRDNQWPIVALLEFEQGTLRTQVEEVQVMFDYCKRAVLS